MGFLPETAPTRQAAEFAEKVQLSIKGLKAFPLPPPMVPAIAPPSLLTFWLPLKVQLSTWGSSTAPVPVKNRPAPKLTALCEARLFVIVQPLITGAKVMGS